MNVPHRLPSEHAVHEAGHAVVAVACNLPLLLVSIENLPSPRVALTTPKDESPLAYQICMQALAAQHAVQLILSRPGSPGAYTYDEKHVDDLLRGLLAETPLPHLATPQVKALRSQVDEDVAEILAQPLILTCIEMIARDLDVRRSLYGPPVRERILHHLDTLGPIQISIPQWFEDRFPGSIVKAAQSIVDVWNEFNGEVESEVPLRDELAERLRNETAQS